MGEEPSSPRGSPTLPEGPGRYSVVIITAVIAAAAPLTVAIHECSSRSKEIELAERNKDRDLEMARRDQAFKTQSWFLQNAVDPQKTPELRQQVLRFIKGVPGDPNLTNWATAELTRVDEVVALSRKLATKEQELASRDKEVARAKVEAARQATLAGKKAAETTASKIAVQDALNSQEKAEKEAAGLREQLASKGVLSPAADPTIAGDGSKQMPPPPSTRWSDREIAEVVDILRVMDENALRDLLAHPVFKQAVSRLPEDRKLGFARTSRDVLQNRLNYVLATLDAPARRDFIIYLKNRFSGLHSSR
jgi:hypothetical protein